jgi:hypothetical protein
MFDESSRRGCYTCARRLRRRYSLPIGGSGGLNVTMDRRLPATECVGGFWDALKDARDSAVADSHRAAAR